MTKVEYKSILHDVAYIRKLAEEIIDELYCLECSVEEFYENRAKRGRSSKHLANNDVIAVSLTPKALELLGVQGAEEEPS